MLFTSTGASMTSPDLVTRPTQMASDRDDMASIPTSSSDEVLAHPTTGAGSPKSNSSPDFLIDKMPPWDDSTPGDDTGIVEHPAELNPSHPALDEKHAEAAMIHPTPMGPDPSPSSRIATPVKRLVGHERDRAPSAPSSRPSLYPPPSSPLDARKGDGDAPVGRKDLEGSRSLPERTSAREQHEHGRNDHESLADSAFYNERSIFSRQRSSASGSQTVMDNPADYENKHSFPPRLPASNPISSTQQQIDAINRIRDFVTDIDGPPEAPARSPPPSTSTSQSGRTTTYRSYSGTSSSSTQNLDDHNLQALWREIKQKQQKVDEIRDEMAFKRSQLRALRPMLYEADNTFMNLIRPILVHKEVSGSASAERIDKTFAELQRLRTERQGLEDAYEELEDAVDEEETVLRRIEIRFYSTLSGNEYGSETSSVLEARGQTRTPIDVPHELQGILAERPLENLDPLFVKLKLAVANLRNDREELSHLQTYKDQCNETIWLKRQHQQTIPPELLDFVREFPSRQASKKEEIAQSEDDVRRLKKACEDNNVMGKHMSPEMRSELYPNETVTDITLPSELEILSKNQNLAHPIFHVLLSDPEHLLQKPKPISPNDAIIEAGKLAEDDPQKAQRVHKARKEASINNLLKPERDDKDEPSLIDRWLLFGLRNSPIEIVRLYNTFVLRLSIRNLRQWQFDVIRFWNADHVAESMHQASSRRSEYYSIVGTLPRSRAASEGTPSMRGPKMHRRAYSGAAKSAKTL